MNESEYSSVKTKLYKKRWIILALFSTYSATNAYQWIQYSIISNNIVRYYNVTSSTADWLSLVFMLVYIPLILPITWALDRFGLRTITLLGSTLNATGALIKIASCEPHLFWVTMLAQTIAAIGQVFILGMPSKLAATWFGSKEVSTACSIAVLGNQLGVAFGFLIPSLVVPPSEDTNEIESGLRTLFIGSAVFISILVILIWFIFQNKPKLPPSQAQNEYLNGEYSISYLKSIKHLFLNKSSILLILSYGINTGCVYSISTLLNDQILYYYPGEEEKAGEIGLTMIVVGICGSLVGGIILDKTKAYKKTTTVVYILTLISLGFYTGIITIGNLWLVYIAIGLVGFTMTGYLPVGFEFAAEITYPICEGISSGLLNTSAQIFGIILTLLMRMVMTKLSVLSSNLLMCLFLLIGSVMTVLIKEDLKRQKANQIPQLIISTET